MPTSGVTPATTTPTPATHKYSSNVQQITGSLRSAFQNDGTAEIQAARTATNSLRESIQRELGTDSPRGFMLDTGVDRVVDALDLAEGAMDPTEKARALQKAEQEVRALDGQLGQPNGKSQ